MTVTVTAPPPPNVPPTVSLTSPVAGASIVLGASFTLTASASDSDGTVSKVEFYAGTTKLSQSTSAPYTFDWTPAQVGDYTLTAIATDNVGAATTTGAVAVTVAAPPPSNVPPAVSLTEPSSERQHRAGRQFDADGERVGQRRRREQGGVLHGRDETRPVHVAAVHLQLQTAQTGSYTLTAVATDNVAASATSGAVMVTVTAPPPPNVPPTVNLTSQLRTPASCWAAV